MSASLVGSEMCIRDRQQEHRQERRPVRPPGRFGPGGRGLGYGQWAVEAFVRRVGWSSEFSHVEPAGPAESARSAIVVFKSKYSRDGSLKAVENVGFPAQGLWLQVGLQVSRYLREGQQLLRCCAKARCQVRGVGYPLKPERGAQAVTDQGAWCLAMADHDESPLYKDIAAASSTSEDFEAFESALSALWAIWGGRQPPPNPTRGPESAHPTRAGSVGNYLSRVTRGSIVT
eukprot:5254185-Alexandrium_andersonii.AAC.1